jgi:predicted nucleic acid-binding protein
MGVYCDTNFLVRLYATAPSRDQALDRIAALPGRGPRIPITWLHELELSNALQQMVLLSRTGMGMSFTPEQASLGLLQFEDDLREAQRFAAASLVPREMVHQARELSLRHTALHGFRAYDVAHVACALLLKCDSFWSFDTKANLLAKLEGLNTL